MNTLSVDEIIGIAHRSKSLMHREELAWLLNLAQQAPDGTGVEVGVYCGASLIAWSLMRQGRGAAIGVDNWSYQDEYIDRYVIKGMEHNGLRLDGLRGICEKNLAAAQVEAQLLDGDSVLMAQRVWSDLAFVLIDGDHTSPGIDNDITAWMPKLMSGGIAAFHDYGRRKNGCRVTQAVDNWQAVAHWGKVGQVDTLIGYRKP
jgi:hypothetical protein